MIELQKNEAIKRMKKMELIENVIEDFKGGVINKSERSIFPGILYWLNDEEKEMVRIWEKDTGNIVYHVIKDVTNIGTMYSFLYVSKYEEEWELDNDDLSVEMAVAFCVLGEDLSYGEYGSIGVRSVNGGLQRLW